MNRRAERRQRRRERRRQRGTELLDGLVAEIELEDLARYNAERKRGLVHTPEWQAEMAEIRQRLGFADTTPRETP